MLIPCAFCWETAKKHFCRGTRRARTPSGKRSWPAAWHLVWPRTADWALFHEETPATHEGIHEDDIYRLFEPIGPLFWQGKDHEKLKWSYFWWLDVLTYNIYIYRPNVDSWLIHTPNEEHVQLKWEGYESRVYIRTHWTSVLTGTRPWNDPKLGGWWSKKKRSLRFEVEISEAFWPHIYIYIYTYWTRDQ